MKKNIINFLRTLFPFLLTIGLWRLSTPFWNSGGVLAIIPIFFCSFVSPVRWFGIFSIFLCLCLDYNFETVCFWIAIYCLFYAINGFQSFIDITRMDKNGLPAFMVMFGIAILFQVLGNFSAIGFLRGAWMFVWVCTMYMPITILIQRIHDD